LLLFFISISYSIGVAHCSDGSDEISNPACMSNIVEPLNNKTIESKNRAMITKHHQWRGILIVAFLLIILIVFTIFMIYLICRRCLHRPIPLITGVRKSYSTIVNSRMLLKVFSKSNKKLVSNF
jgi:hypothetical protein